MMLCIAFVSEPAANCVSSQSKLVIENTQFRIASGPVLYNAR